MCVNLLNLVYLFYKTMLKKLCRFYLLIWVSLMTKDIFAGQR